MTTGWKLWIPAHAINFGFIPPSQRVLYVNVIAVRLSLLSLLLSLSTFHVFASQSLHMEGCWGACFAQGGHHGNVTAAVPAVQIAWTYLLSRAASDAQPLDSEEDDRLVEAHPS